MSVMDLLARASITVSVSRKVKCSASAAIRPTEDFPVPMKPMRARLCMERALVTGFDLTVLSPVGTPFLGVGGCFPASVGPRAVRGSQRVRPRNRRGISSSVRPRWWLLRAEGGSRSGAAMRSNLRGVEIQPVFFQDTDSFAQLGVLHRFHQARLDVHGVSRLRFIRKFSRAQHDDRKLTRDVRMAA